MKALQEQVMKGVKILKQGGIVAFPTDTVYGLGADAFNFKAVERIYHVKKRPKHLPFPLLLSDISQVTVVAQTVSGIDWFLARRFWPGGLTLILPKTASLPAYLAKGPTVAIRIPNHPVCLALIRYLGGPMIGTSANISGEPSALTADEVKKQMGQGIDFIIDGGKCPGGSESTIVDATSGVPVILRQGIIPQHKIEEAYAEYQQGRQFAACSWL
jgi:L-threonylcarbamoyladenylate synthase